MDLPGTAEREGAVRYAGCVEVEGERRLLLPKPLKTSLTEDTEDSERTF